MTPIILCAGPNGRAVVFGFVTEAPVAGQPVTLHRARMVLYWPATCGGLFGLAAHGPKPGTRLTDEIAETTTTTWAQTLAVSPEAAAAFEAYRG